MTSYLWTKYEEKKKGLQIMSLSATQARLTRAAWVEYGGIPIFQIVDFPKRPIFLTERRCFGQTRSVISPRFPRIFDFSQLPRFRANFDSFQKFTFDFLNLENLGTNLENKILICTCTPG